MNTSSLKWTGTIFQMGGVVLLASNVSVSAWAFPFMLLGSLLWVLVAVRTKDKALGALNIVYSLTNVLGIIRWLA